MFHFKGNYGDTYSHVKSDLVFTIWALLDYTISGVCNPRCKFAQLTNPFLKAGYFVQMCYTHTGHL
jgi:hypothetical protein